jgi:hypothetical protein
MRRTKGVWLRYGFEGKIIALLRGACEAWAHPHSASKLVRGAIKLLPERYRVVTATCDGLAGEVGTISIRRRASIMSGRCTMAARGR